MTWRPLAVSALVSLSVACSAGRDAAQPPAPVAAAETPAPAPANEPAPAKAEPATELPPRPDKDVARDADRKPFEVLAFFGIGEGMRVVELMAGSGYYVEVLARVVGRKGEVWAHNSPFVLKRYAEKPISARLEKPELSHVERLDTELDDPQLPPDLDAVVMILFYHDTYWQGVDRTKMNAAVFAALRPGGVFGVVDHHAEAGSGDRDVKSLHRIDAELLEKEVLAAGFELEAKSDLLRRPEDDRKTNVFDIRGKSDRFVYKFRKPAPPRK